MNIESQILGLLNQEETDDEDESTETDDGSVDDSDEEGTDDDEEGTDDDEEGTDEGQDAEALLEEIVHNGEVKKLTKAELKELAQKGFDYTQKTQALSEERRVAQEEIQAARQRIQQEQELQQQFSHDIGLMTAIDIQIQQFAQVDFDALDPQQRFELKDRLRDLKEAKQVVQGNIEAARQAYQREMQREAEKQIRAGIEQLKRDIPGFNAEVAQQITEFGSTLGFSPEEIRSIQDPRAIKTLHLAMQYQKLQSGKANTLKRVQSAPPVVKPGTAAKQAPNRSKQLQQMRERGGRVEDAAKLFEDLI